ISRQVLRLPRLYLVLRGLQSSPSIGFGIRMSSLSTTEATRLRPATVRLAHVCSNAPTARCSAADSSAPARTSAARSGRRWARGRQVADRSPHGRPNRGHRTARFAARRCPNGVHSRTAGQIPQQEPSGGGEIRTRTATRTTDPLRCAETLTAQGLAPSQASTAAARNDPEKPGFSPQNPDQSGFSPGCSRAPARSGRAPEGASLRGRGAAGGSEPRGHEGFYPCGAPPPSLARVLWLRRTTAPRRWSQLSRTD